MNTDVKNIRIDDLAREVSAELGMDSQDSETILVVLNTAFKLGQLDGLDSGKKIALDAIDRLEPL